MEYHEAVNRLEGLRRLRPKLGTETTASLLAVHDDPHENLTAVQIAGSNGKGSTASVLDSILREAGLTVGLYTSPDLADLRERVRVQGEKIPESEVVEFVRETWPTIVDGIVEDDAPTFFEAFTAMALWHFEREDVDVAVLEVGIGGRYDATSVVDPVASAVTTVSLEHTDILGSTVEEIARDKAQVAPEGRPLVTGATGEALETIREVTDVVTVSGTTEIDEASEEEERTETTADVQVAETEMSPAAGTDQPTEASLSLTGPEWSVDTRTPLLGAHQALNAGIAATLARQVASPTESDIARGIRNVTWPGRFEVMDQHPLVVLDGAHNPAACERLSRLLGRFEFDRLHLVFGAMRDKDHAGMVRSLPTATSVFLTEPDVSRVADPEVLAAVFDRETDASVTQAGPVLGGLEQALSAASADDCVLVSGSLYAVAEARDRFARRPVPVRTETKSQAASLLERTNVSTHDRHRSRDELVTRTVRLPARHGEAATIEGAMRSVGGTCVVSGIETSDQRVEVVLAGTLTQFEELVDVLGSHAGHAHLAGQLEAVLSLGEHEERTLGEPVSKSEIDESTADYPWEENTAVMGIVNVTPDSFHDGGRYDVTETAVAHAEEMVEAGADIIDVGGESTRPGADPVSTETELDRVLPVIESLADLDTLVSIDSRKPAVVRAALDAGADIVNDVTALTDAAMRRTVADADVPVVAMHSLSAPVDPTRRYAYDDVVTHVIDTLTEQLLLAERAGIDRSKIIVDPGLGFGKTAAESFELLERLDEFQAFGVPVMVGHSHKSMFSDLPHGDDRLAHTVAASALAVDRGADIVRVHDVSENVAAVATAVRQSVAGLSLQHGGKESQYTGRRND